MQGKLIVIDGLDSSGKETQSRMLEEHFKKEGVNCRRVEFPNYKSESSTLVKMYLRGDFGSNASEVNPYAASSFYAVDRYASFTLDWKSDYESDKIIVADRYATSKSIYQTEKIAEADWDSYLDWSADFEYYKLGIPKPDAVIYLDMPVDISQKLMTGRYGGNESKKDVHEADVAFLEKCRKSALYAASRQGWHIVECSNGKEPYSIEKIHNEIMKIVDEELC